MKKIENERVQRLLVGNKYPGQHHSKANVEDPRRFHTWKKIIRGKCRKTSTKSMVKGRKLFVLKAQVIIYHIFRLWRVVLLTYVIDGNLSQWPYNGFPNIRTNF